MLSQEYPFSSGGSGIPLQGGLQQCLVGPGCSPSVPAELGSASVPLVQDGEGGQSLAKWCLNLASVQRERVTKAGDWD